jgi:hypothetical protein
MVNQRTQWTILNSYVKSPESILPEFINDELSNFLREIYEPTDSAGKSPKSSEFNWCTPVDIPSIMMIASCLNPHFSNINTCRISHTMDRKEVILYIPGFVSWITGIHF